MTASRRDPNQQPIKPELHDVDLQDRKQNSDRLTYTNKRTNRVKTLVTELAPFALFLFIPLSVYVGVFSALFKADASEVVAKQVAHVETSMQTVSLLSATNNVDPIGARGGGDVLIEEGALVSQGPASEDDRESTKTKNGEISLYVVRPGDSLSQIAEMYGVTTNTILWANDISKATAIRPGDTLVILPIVGVRYEVAKGDTLGSIAKKFGGDVDEILEYNRIASADDVSVGDELVIPGGEIQNTRTANTSTRVTTNATPVKVTGNAASSNSFSHPVPGAVRSQGIHGYNGVDLAAAAGTPIRAAAAGEVIVSKGSGWNGGYGNYIVIKHSNGTQTLYAHNSSNAVGVGAWVAQGEVIGYVGSTGRSTGNHVHFEVRGAANPF